jgi:uncharacterized membrane protein YheB (UPF0754 family)
METFLLILRYAAGPILGALIGYLTNWLAVKMLFRPYYPKKIGKWTLPFTPGIIPKRKSALAKAVGKAVGEELFTKDDLQKSLLGDGVKDKVCGGIVSSIYGDGDSTLESVAKDFVTDEKYESALASTSELLTDKLTSAIENADIGGLVAEKGVSVLNEKKSSLGMIAMFITDDLVQSVLSKVGQGVNDYVQQNGREFIKGKVDEELKNLSKSSLSTVTSHFDRDMVYGIVEKVYDKVASVALSSMLEGVDISGIVEKKINEMDVKELEKLVLSVMKKELNSIVNLGALIGFVLGIIMIFI